jgi:hypothetical protein
MCCGGSVLDAKRDEAAEIRLLGIAAGQLQGTESKDLPDRATKGSTGR